MKNLNPNFIPQDNKPADNVSAEAKSLLVILDELENFTLGLRKKLMTEFKTETNSDNRQN